ncbi:hypothetical protein PR048_012189 [Dryococelus australis]|uniref:Uncharacterized protein n=1 Tax=Dryococelus australis TaxID=614101 RepID=A0ABQ9HPX8_9NEOP|nr:hypothetical protein PR048_012189 [Dryococelus australis]
MKGRGKRDIPEKTRRPAALSDSSPTRKNPGVTWPGIEPGSPWWEASRLTGQPPRPPPRDHDACSSAFRSLMVRRLLPGGALARCCTDTARVVNYRCVSLPRPISVARAFFLAHALLSLLARRATAQGCQPSHVAFPSTAGWRHCPSPSKTSHEAVILPAALYTTPPSVAFLHEMKLLSKMVVMCVAVCRSCIVRHLRTSKFCPACDVQLHKTRPLLSISTLAFHQGDPGSIRCWVIPDFRIWESCRTMPLVGWFNRGYPVSPPLHSGAAPLSSQLTSSALKTSMPDRTLQTLVYKLVPNLYHNEMRRRHQFVREHVDEVAYEDAQRLLAEDDFFSADDAISLSIQYYERSATPLHSFRSRSLTIWYQSKARGSPRKDKMEKGLTQTRTHVLLARCLGKEEDVSRRLRLPWFGVLSTLHAPRLIASACLELSCAFEAEKRGSDKVDTVTSIKCPIATKCQARNWRAVFSSHCKYLRDSQR